MLGCSALAAAVLVATHQAWLYVFLTVAAAFLAIGVWPVVVDGALARVSPEERHGLSVVWNVREYVAIAATTALGGYLLDVSDRPTLLLGLATALVMLTLRRIWNERLALVGGVLVALDPFTKHYVPRVFSEVLAIFFVAAGAYCFARAWQERSWPWWGAFGVTAAALTLTRPLFLFTIPLAVIAALARQDLARRRIGAAAATAVCAGLLLAPWLAWTHAATGRFAVSSFGEGWNLLIAAHGEGLHRTAVQVENDPAYVHDFNAVHRFAPAASVLRHDPDAHPRYLARAESEQRRLALDLYRTRVRHEPLTVAGEIGYRAYFLWMVHEDWIQPSWLVPLLKVADWLALGLALVGLAVGIRRDGATRALVLFLLAFTALSALHHVEARYAIPIRTLFLAFVALGLAATVRWTHERARRRQ